MRNQHARGSPQASPHQRNASNHVNKTIGASGGHHIDGGHHIALGSGVKIIVAG